MAIFRFKIKKNSYLQWFCVSPRESCKLLPLFNALSETVTSFKYQGSLVTDEGSKPEILSRIAQTNSSIDKVETSLE